MFLILIKPPEGKASYAVVGGPFKQKMDAVLVAKNLAADAPNTFAVVKVEAMYRRAVTITEVEIAP